MFLIICGMHRFYFIAMGIFGILLSPLIYTFGLTSYQKGRIISWFSSDQTLSEKWNILQSEISIGSGGLFGEGFLNSKQNEFNFLPEADTDFIFSIYAEQFGFIGVFLILTLLGCFIVMTTLLTMTDKRLTSDLSPFVMDFSSMRINCACTLSQMVDAMRTASKAISFSFSYFVPDAGATFVVVSSATATDDACSLRFLVAQS